MAMPEETRSIPEPGTVVGFVVGGTVVTTTVGGGEVGFWVATVVTGRDVVAGTVVTGTVVGTCVVTVGVPPPVDIESEGDTDEVMSGFTLLRSICF